MHMTPRDRVIAALNHQEPDRVPTGENQVDGAIVDRILGRHTLYNAGQSEDIGKVVAHLAAAGLAPPIAAVASISIRAPVSTSPTTSTNAMAGKCFPMTER